MKTAGNQASIAIVILNWNGRALLEEFLPSVIATDYPQASVWLADNASTDDSVEFVKQHYPQVKLVVLDKNWGFAEGYNKALQQIEADYYLLLNSDVEMTPDCVSKVMTELQKDPSVGAAQPKILAQKQKTHFEYAGACGGFLDKWGYSFCRGRIFDTVEEDILQYQQKMEIAWAGGCAIFVKSTLYHKLNGLDADFFAHFEEIDLCWRLRRAGYKVMVYPQATVYHVGGATLSSGSPRKTYLNFRNNLAMLIKNLPTSKLLWLLPWRMVLDGVAGIKFLADRQPKNLWAVIKAHWSIEWRFFFWLKKRRLAKEAIESCAISKEEQVVEYPKSILLAYFGKKQQKYSDLNL